MKTFNLTGKKTQYLDLHLYKYELFLVCKQFTDKQTNRQTDTQTFLEKKIHICRQENTSIYSIFTVSLIAFH